MEDEWEDNYKHDMDMLDMECYGCEYEYGCMGNVDEKDKEALVHASNKTGILITILPKLPCRPLKGCVGVITHSHGTDHTEFWEIVEGYRINNLSHKGG